MVHADLFLHKLVPKIEVLEVFAVVLVSSKKSTVGVVIGTKFWSIQVQCCKTKKKKKKKKLALSICFFPILHEKYIQKQQAMVIQIPQWEFKANITRNSTFNGN